MRFERNFVYEVQKSVFILQVMGSHWGCFRQQRAMVLLVSDDVALLVERVMGRPCGHWGAGFKGRPHFHDPGICIFALTSPTTLQFLPLSHLSNSGSPVSMPSGGSSFGTLFSIQDFLQVRPLK